MSVEEILAALKAILDTAEGRDLSEDEVRSYEDLEKQLAVAQKSAEVRARQKAYETPVKSNLDAIAHVAAAKPDNTLERAFSHYLRTGIGNQDIVQLRAQGLTDAAGGYMVPPGFRQKLVDVQKAFGGLANEVENITTDSGNTLEYPSLDDTANSGSITAESASFANGADLVFGTVALGAFKYTSMGAGSSLPLRVSVELLQDSAFDVESLVARKLGERIARKQASDWCTGTGTSLPFGICHANLTPDETADAPPTIDYDDLLDTEASLDPAYEQNAKWVMNKATWTSIRGLLDQDNRPLIFDQAASGIAGRPEKQLLGYPVVIDQAMPDVSGGAGRNCVVLGDLREAYVIRHVSNFVVVVDPYTRSSNGEVQYVAWERADGNIQNRNAYKVLKA